MKATPQQIQWLVDNYTLSAEELIKATGLTDQVIYYHLRKNGIVKRKPAVDDRTFRFLEDNYEKLSNKALASITGISLSKLQNLAFKNGWERTKEGTSGKIWSDEEIKYLCHNHHLLIGEIMRNLPSRSKFAIYAKKKELEKQGLLVEV